MWQNTSLVYGVVTKFLHWLIAVLVLFMLVYGFFLDDFPQSIQPTTYNIHKLIGLSIFVLMSLRLVWTLTNPKPELPFNTPNWQRYIEWLIQSLMYVTVIAMPLMGLIGSSAAGRPPHLGGWIISLPVQKSEPLSDFAFDLHNKLAFLLIALLTIHILAALYHHFIRKDHILLRMLPTHRGR